MKSMSATIAPSGYTSPQMPVYHNRRIRPPSTTVFYRPATPTAEPYQQRRYQQHFLASQLYHARKVDSPLKLVSATPPPTGAVDVKTVEKKIAEYYAQLVPNRIAIKVTQIDSVFFELTKGACLELSPSPAMRLLIRDGAAVAFNPATQVAALHHPGVQVLYTPTSTAARFLGDSLAIDIDNIGGGITLTGSRSSWTLDAQNITPISESNGIANFNLSNDISRAVFTDQKQANKENDEKMADRCLEMAKSASVIDLTLQRAHNMGTEFDDNTLHNWYHVLIDNGRYRLRHEATTGQTHFACIDSEYQLSIDPTTQAARLLLPHLEAAVNPVIQPSRTTHNVIMRVRPTRSLPVKITCTYPLLSICFEGAQQGNYTFGEDGRLCHNPAAFNKHLISQ